MDEIEVKRGDANGENQHGGYKDPQHPLDHYANILWYHNGKTNGGGVNGKGQ